MTVDAAFEFFAEEPAIARALDVLRQVGVGYLRLGQPATELSGGEAQRIKLATELQRGARGDALYILDEPTTGLHPADVEKLVAQLDALVDAGNTVICVEHDMRVVAASDWVIDIGPGAGDEGGRIVAQGTPAELARSQRQPHGAVSEPPSLRNLRPCAPPAHAHVDRCSMTDTYRDDLDAALARASDSKREVEALRERNAELEMSPEARENARRLAAALERERAEVQQHHQSEVDSAHWMQASREEAKAARAANDVAKQTTIAPVKRREVTKAKVLVGIVGMVGGGMAGVVAAIVNSEPIGAVALVMFLVGAAAVAGMIGRPPSA